MLLSDYIQNTRDVLHDPNANFYSDAQLTRWINRARRQTSKDGECVRILTPSMGSVLTIMVTNGGSGYTTGTVSIALPDGGSPNLISATAAPTFTGGQLTAVTVLIAGTGYVAIPAVTVTGNGTGATAVATLTPHLATVLNQETYTYASTAALVAVLYPGAGQIIGVQSVAVAWGSAKPVLDHLPFSGFQAFLRSWPSGLQGPPAAWSQIGQGAQGSMMLWPVPTQVTRMEWDCYCSTADLTANNTVPDLVPEPWDEAVAYYAAKYAYEYAQRPDDMQRVMSEYNRLMLNARAAVTPPVVPSFYGGIVA